MPHILIRNTLFLPTNSLIAYCPWALDSGLFHSSLPDRRVKAVVSIGIVRVNLKHGGAACRPTTMEDHTFFHFPFPDMVVCISPLTRESIDD